MTEDDELGGPVRNGTFQKCGQKQSKRKDRQSPKVPREGGKGYPCRQDRFCTKERKSGVGLSYRDCGSRTSLKIHNEVKPGQIWWSHDKNNYSDSNERPTRRKDEKRFEILFHAEVISKNTQNGGLGHRTDYKTRVAPETPRRKSSRRASGESKSQEKKKVWFKDRPEGGEGQGQDSLRKRGLCLRSEKNRNTQYRGCKNPSYKKNVT